MGRRWKMIEKKGLEGLLIKLKGTIDAQFKLANVRMVPKALSTSTSKQSTNSFTLNSDQERSQALKIVNCQGSNLYEADRAFDNPSSLYFLLLSQRLVIFHSFSRTIDGSKTCLCQRMIGICKILSLCKSINSFVCLECFLKRWSSYSELLGIKLSQLNVCLCLFKPYKICRITIEWRISIWIGQKVQKSSAKSLQSPSWTPLSFDNIKANFSGHEMNVRMENFRLKVQFRRSYWVLRGQINFYQKDIVCIRCFARPLNECFPREQICLIKHKQEFAEFLL